MVPPLFLDLLACMVVLLVCKLISCGSICMAEALQLTTVDDVRTLA